METKTIVIALVSGLKNRVKLEVNNIHHALCGHGSERVVIIAKKERSVDRYEPTTKTVFEYNGCKWHGCPCQPDITNNDKNRFIARYLNCRIALETYHLSTHSVSLIRALWGSILPHSFTMYVHEEGNIVLFSLHSSSTFKKRCGVLKKYFDMQLEEICTSINDNLPLIRNIFELN